jgi:hypothetical protein
MNVRGGGLHLFPDLPHHRGQVPQDLIIPPPPVLPQIRQYKVWIIIESLNVGFGGGAEGGGGSYTANYYANRG